MEQDTLGPIDFNAIYDEITNEFIERMIRDLQEKTLRLAKDLAKHHYNTSFNKLPYITKKRIWTEAADLITDQVIEESGGKIY